MKTLIEICQFFRYCILFPRQTIDTFKESSVAWSLLSKYKDDVLSWGSTNLVAITKQSRFLIFYDRLIRIYHCDVLWDSLWKANKISLLSIGSSAPSESEDDKDHSSHKRSKKKKRSRTPSLESSEEEQEPVKSSKSSKRHKKKAKRKRKQTVCITLSSVSTGGGLIECFGF